MQIHRHPPMPRICYHAPHEQFSPGTLLRYVRLAEDAGYDGAMCSDHFFPWLESQGQSGLAWAWLGAALQATSFSIGQVNAPGQRYHPAIAAQAFATLAEMFPGRYWAALGSGQLLNEHITGERWPSKPERMARLEECVAVIRALLAGETVTHFGRVRVDEARLYTRPAQPPPLLATALTPETARWAGGWADGLLTSNASPEAERRILDAFREGGGEGKPCYVQANHLWAPDEAAGRREAHDQWRGNVLGTELQADLRTPAAYEAAATHVREEDVARYVRISGDPHRHAAWINEYFETGFDGVYIHEIGRDQERSITAFGEQILPALGRR